MRTFVCLVVPSMLLLFVGDLTAEQRVTYDASVNFMASGINQNGKNVFETFQLQKGFTPVYSIYPSLSLTSTGRHSLFTFDYTFVGDHFQMNPAVTTASHAVRTELSAQLSRRWHLGLSDSFSTMPDTSTISVLRGQIPTLGGFRYVFAPGAPNRSTLDNNAAGSIGVELSRSSSLTFSGRYAYRDYKTIAPSSASLFNQRRTEGGVEYSRRQSTHTSWHAHYILYANDFTGLGSTRSHGVALGFSKELSPTLSFDVEAGPSFTERSREQKAYVGYLASVLVSKTLRSNRFSLNYWRRTGDSTGLGTATDSHQFGIAFSRTIGPNASVSCAGSAFRQRQRFTGAYDYWGGIISLAVSKFVRNHWVFSIGASGQHYEGKGTSISTLTYSRLYVALGYNFSELRRASK